jgi:hypothetical protein
MAVSESPPTPPVPAITTSVLPAPSVTVVDQNVHDAVFVPCT